MEITRIFVDVLRRRLADPLNFIQVVIGPRQVGKTTGVQSIVDSWNGPKVYAAADLPSPPSPVWIQEQWDKARAMGENTLLVLDEIQKVERWSEVVKHNFDVDRKKRSIKVVLLGSASLSIQAGLTESLAGRFELIKVYHWNYLECHKAFGWNIDTYLQYGGYPGPAELTRDPIRWQQFIRDSIVEPVLARDVTNFRTITKPSLFRQTFELALSYPAQEVSFQKFLGQLQDKGNAATIKGYLELLEGAFVLRILYKFSTRPLSVRSSSPKILPLAPALMHTFKAPSSIFTDSAWRGHVFEAAIGAALLQTPREVFYWRDGNNEVDYVLKKDKQILAIEVKSGRLRRGQGIQAFKEKFPDAKTIVMDRELGEMFLAAPSFEEFLEGIVR